MNINTFYVHSLGCAKNLVDTEGLAGFLQKRGFRMVGSAQEADAVILNTCAFIADALAETIEWINYYSELKRKIGFVFIVFGCYVESQNKRLLEKFPQVDYFLGANQIRKIADILNGQSEIYHFIRGGEPFFWEASMRKNIQAGLPSRYLKISEGCNRKCSFCIIPELRGRLRSNSTDELYKEAKILVGSGAREINIISQDTSSYGRDSKKRNNLVELINKLARIQGLEFLRLLYLYPDGVDKALIDAFCDNPVVCRYFDIPIQHISDKILKLMCRASRKKSIRSLFETIKSRLPDAAIRSTIIVGFPGEGAAEFDELLKFVEEGWFDHLGVFAYSPNPRLADLSRVSQKEALKRQKLVYDVQKQVVRKKLKAFIGSRQKVLIESASKNSAVGRTQYQAPEVDGVVKFDTYKKPGSIVNAMITGYKGYDLETK